jgi:hypothetical protein
MSKNRLIEFATIVITLAALVVVFKLSQDASKWKPATRPATTTTSSS